MNRKRCIPSRSTFLSGLTLAASFATFHACGTQEEYVQTVMGERVRVATVTTWDRAKDRARDGVSAVRDYFRPAPPEVKAARTLDQARDLIAQARGRLESGEDPTPVLKTLHFLAQTIQEHHQAFMKHVEDLDRRLVEGGFPPIALERQQAMKAHYAVNQEAFTSFLGLIETGMGVTEVMAGKPRVAVGGPPVEQALTLAQNFLDQVHPSTEPPPLRSEPLPFRPIEPREEPPIYRTAITPAFQGGPPSPSGGSLGQTPTEADLAESKEIRFSDDLKALAQKFECKPVEMYEHVRNEFVVEFYRGSWKGSDLTIRERAGNDFDLAGVLIGLLRYCGRPARYVKGVVQVPIDRAAQWAGVTEPSQAVSVLAMARIPVVSVLDGEVLVGVRLEHAWVETFVPYGMYRGTLESEGEKMWIPLDPSFKLHDVRPPKFDFFKESALNADAFLREYLSTQRAETMVQFYRKKVETFLATSHPGAGFEDAIWQVKVIPQELGLLPNSLPYKLVQADAEWTEVPDALRYKIKVAVVAEKGPLFEYETDLPSIAGKETLLSYAAFSSDDQAILDQFTSLEEIPPYLLMVTPIIRVANEEVARGSHGLMLSQNHRMEFTYLSPTGEVSTGSTPVSAGNVEAIGIDIQKPVTALGTSKSAMVGVDGGVAETLLPMVVQDYLIRTDTGGREAAQALGVQLFNEVATTIVGNSITTAYVFGVPQDFAWKGLFVDSFRNVLGPVPRDGNPARRKAFFILAGAEGSAHEHLLFEEAFQVGSVSAIRGLQFANDQGTPLLEINASNLDAQLALLQASDNLKQSIRDAVHAGRVITIPQAQLHIHNWVGTVYLTLDPITGAGGWMIAGQIPLAGGGTSEIWPADFQELWNKVVVEEIGGTKCSFVRKTNFKSLGAGAVFIRGEHRKGFFTGTTEGFCEGKGPVELHWFLVMSFDTSNLPGGRVEIKYAPNDPDPWVGSILDIQVDRGGGERFFDPEDEDPSRRFTTIHYDIISDENGLSRVSDVMFRVFDKAGKTVIYEQSQLSVASEVTWNGRTSSGDLAEFGDHPFQIDVRINNVPPGFAPRITDTFGARQSPEIPAGKRGLRTPIKFRIKTVKDCNTGLESSRIVFSAAFPGTLCLQAEAEIEPEEVKMQSTWSLRSKGESKQARKATPDDGRGDTVKYVFTGLFDGNQQYGKRKLSLDFFSFGSLPITREREVVFFYPKLAKNHPGVGTGRTPNWYFYWSQTKANHPPHVYEGTVTFLDVEISCSFIPGTLGFSVPTEDHAHICDLTGTSHLGSEFRSEAEGIDLFGANTRHEQAHVKFFNNWWPGNVYDPSKDADGDLIPNSVEIVRGLNPFLRDSSQPRDGIDDGHELVRPIEQQWVLGSADCEDFSLDPNYPVHFDRCLK